MNPTVVRWLCYLKMQCTLKQIVKHSVLLSKNLFILFEIRKNCGDMWYDVPHCIVYMGVLFIANHTTVIVWCIVRSLFFLYIVIYSPSHKSFKCKLWNTWSFIFYALPIHVFWAVFEKKNGLRSVWTSCIVGTMLGHCMPKLNLHYCFWFIKFCQVVLKMKHPYRYNLTIML